MEIKEKIYKKLIEIEKITAKKEACIKNIDKRLKRIKSIYKLKGNRCQD